MDDFLMQPILNELNNQDGMLEPVQRRRGDPVRELSNAQFIRVFRVTKDLFAFIVETLTPFLRPQSRRSDLDIPTRILTALRFYAAGSYQTDVGYNWCIGISQSSVSRCLREVTDAFNRPEILNRFIHFPQNILELQNIRRRFYEKFEFPGVIGCIDCTHIAIVPPKNDPDMPEHIFVNRKQYHSLNVQLICDPNLKILNINARYPGSTHDSFIWNNSGIKEVLQTVYRAGGRDFFLLGDSGYALRPWLLTPLEEAPAPNSREFRYNEAQKQIRSIIERCNGLLKGRFRCCLKHRVLHYAPDVAGKIINACAILHNLCIEHNIPEPELEAEDDPDNGLFGAPHLENLEVPQGVRINPDLYAARIIRNQIIATRFQ